MTTLESTPWSLHFDRDGTEDFGVILDADGEELVRSREFWLPEKDDPIPPTLAALYVMHAAPRLLEALIRAEFLLRRIHQGDGQALRNAKQAADQARLAIIQAEPRHEFPSTHTRSNQHG